MSELRFFEKLDIIDAAIEQGPQEHRLPSLIEFFSDEVIAKYFFENLPTPDWIPILNDFGIFEFPPEPIHEDGWIRTPNWPQSMYLSRMAAIEPNMVTETLVNLPESDNEQIHSDIAKSVLELPVEQGERLVKRELNWIERRQYFYSLYPEVIGEVILYLIKNDRIELARRLTSALLKLYPVVEDNNESASRLNLSVEVGSLLNKWNYQSIVKKVGPSIVALDTGDLDGLEVFCKLLDDAISINANDREPPIDYSWIWRGSIGDHEQNLRATDDIQSLLLVTVRDGVLALAEEHSSAVKQLVGYLEKKRWVLFKRIAIYLLSKFPESEIAKVQEHLTNRELFEDPAFRNEYARLAQNGFRFLDDSAQKVVLSWLDQGPDRNEFLIRFAEVNERNPSEEEFEKYSNFWRRDKLSLFSGNLPPKWEERLAALIRDIGEPSHPEFASFSTSWIGPTSPLSAEEIKEMEVSDLVNYLNKWVTSDEEFGHSADGLSRALGEAVSWNWDKFSSNIHVFTDLPPIYISGLIDGLKTNLDKHSDEVWNGSLTLCKSFLEQKSNSEQDSSTSSGFDHKSSWTRQQIASYLKAGLSSGDYEIPQTFRDLVWSVLNTLLADPDPDPSSESFDSAESTVDPTSISINSVRGQAMIALIEYGLWLNRNVEEGKNGFAVMPEVETALNQHLSYGIDPSLAVRSVYGQWFPWLNLLDKEWVESSKNIIFDEDKPDYWDAAWKSYVVFCRPYDDVLEVLEAQYLGAIDKIHSASRISVDVADSDEKLVEHLMAFYWRGKADLDGKLIRAFYQNSDVSLRAHALDFLGHSLKNFDQPLHDDIQRRLKELFEYRFEQAVKMNEFDELQGFSWWYYSGRFDDEWANDQLLSVLETPCTIEHLDFIAERLEQLENCPEQVLRCLSAMVGRLSLRGSYFSWSDHAESILKKLCKQESVEIRNSAEDLIHQIGSAGYLEFRKLLS